MFYITPTETEILQIQHNYQLDSSENPIDLTLL